MPSKPAEAVPLYKRALGITTEPDDKRTIATTALDRHIEIDPEIAGGKPRIAGHRITVQDVVIWHERLGQSVDAIAATHDLTHAGIHAASAY